MTARTCRPWSAPSSSSCRSTRTALGLFIAALLVSVLPAILLMSLVPRRRARRRTTPRWPRLGLTIVPILAVVFGILGMTNEYRHGTITYTYLDDAAPRMVIVVKLVCYAVVGTAVMALTGFLVILAIEIVASIRDIALPFLEASQASGRSAPCATSRCSLLTVGLMTAFGVGLGALFRAQVPTVAGVVDLVARHREHRRRGQAAHRASTCPSPSSSSSTSAGRSGSEGTPRSDAVAARGLRAQPRLHRRLERRGGVHSMRRDVT